MDQTKLDRKRANVEFRRQQIFQAQQLRNIKIAKKYKPFAAPEVQIPVESTQSHKPQIDFQAVYKQNQLNKQHTFARQFYSDYYATLHNEIGKILTIRQLQINKLKDEKNEFTRKNLESQVEASGVLLTQLKTEKIEVEKMLLSIQ